MSDHGVLRAAAPAVETARVPPNRRLMCGSVILCRPSYLSYSYAVAYSVADPVTRAPTAAGRALAAALAEADAGAAPRLVLPVLLACSSTPIVTDFSQGGC